MSNLWKCYNCLGANSVPGKDFISDDPVCSCGVDKRTAEGAEIVVKVETIHLNPPHAIIKGKGNGLLACTEKPPVSGDRFTGDPDAVTCPECRKTKAWADAYERRHGHQVSQPKEEATNAT